MYSQILVNESDFFIYRRYLMSDKFTENELTEGLIKASSEGAGGEVSKDSSNSDVVANVLSLANGDTEMISRRLGVSPEVAQQLADTTYNNSVNAIDDLKRNTNAKSLAAELGAGVGAGILDMGSMVSTAVGLNGVSKYFSRGANDIRNFANSLKGEDFERFQRAKQLREINYNHNSAVKEQEDIKNGMSSGLAAITRYGRDMIHSFNVASSAELAEGTASGIGYLVPSVLTAIGTGGISAGGQISAKVLAGAGAKLAAKNSLMASMAGGALNVPGLALNLASKALGSSAGKTIAASAILGGGGAESQALETIDNLTDAELQQTPYYKEHITNALKESKGDPVEALKLVREGLETTVMKDAALKGAIAEGGVSALMMGFNKLLGKTPGLKALAIEGPAPAEQQLIEKGIVQKLINKQTLTAEETKILQELQARNGFSLPKTAKQFGYEFKEEALQEGASTYATNTTEKEYVNPDKDVNEGVGESAMQGGIAGLGTKGGAAVATPVKAILSSSAKSIKNTFHKKDAAQATQTQQNAPQTATQQVDSLTPQEKSEKVDNLSTEVVNKVNTLQNTINSENTSDEEKTKAKEELDALNNTFAPILSTDEEKKKVEAIVSQLNADGSKNATVASVNNSKTKKELITTLGNILEEQKAALQTAEGSNADGSATDRINQLKDSMKNTAQEIINLYEASHYTASDNTENQDETAKDLQLNNYLVNSNLDDMVADENSVVNNAYKLIGRDIIRGTELNVNPTANNTLDFNSKLINTRHINAANDAEYANEDVEAAKEIHRSIDTMLGTLKVWDFAENLSIDGDGKRIVQNVESSKQNEDILDVYENKIKSLKAAREAGRLVLSRQDSAKLNAIDKLINLKLDLRKRVTNNNFELTDSEAESIKNGQTSINELLEAKFADEYKIADAALKAYKHSAQNNEQGYNEAVSELKGLIQSNGNIAADLIRARNQAHINASNPTLQTTLDSANTGVTTLHSGNWKGNIQVDDDGHRYFMDDPASTNALHTALRNYTNAMETYNEVASYTNHLPTNRIQAQDAFNLGQEPVIVPPDLDQNHKKRLAVSNSFLKAFGLTRNSGSETDEEYIKRFNSFMKVVPDSIKERWSKINQNAFNSLEKSYMSKNSVEESDKALARKREALGKLSYILGTIANVLTSANLNLNNSDMTEEDLSKHLEAVKAILIGMDSYGFRPKSATSESFNTGRILNNLIPRLKEVQQGSKPAIDKFLQWYSDYSKGTNGGGIANPEETIKYIDDTFAKDDANKISDLFNSNDNRMKLAKGITDSSSLTSTSNIAADATAAAIREAIFGSSPEAPSDSKSALPKVDVGFVQPERDVNVENAAVKEINRRFTENSRDTEQNNKATNVKKNILTKVLNALGDKDSRLFRRHSTNPNRKSNFFRHFGKLICVPELERETSALATFWNNFDTVGGKSKVVLNKLFESIKNFGISSNIPYSDIQSTIESLIENTDFSIPEKNFVKQFFSSQEGQYQSIYNSILTDVKGVINNLVTNKIPLENALSWEEKRGYIPLMAKDGKGNLIPNHAMIAGLTMATMASYVRYINNVPADPFLGDKEWDLVSPRDKQSIEQDMQNSMLTDPITNEINCLFRDIMSISENENADSAATALSGLGGIGLKALANGNVVELVRVKTPGAFINGTNESVTRIKFHNMYSSLLMEDKTNIVYSDFEADLIRNVFSSRPNEDFIIGDDAHAKFLNSDGTMLGKFKKILHTFVTISNKEEEAIRYKFAEAFVPDMSMYKTIEKWGPDATACFLLGLSSEKDLASMSTDLRVQMLSAYSQYKQSFQDMARVKKIRLNILERIASNPKSNVINGITINKDFVERFRNNEVTSKELQKLKSVLGQHFLHQMTRVDRFNATGHSAVGDKIKRLYETNNDAPLTIENDRNSNSFKIFTRALSQAFGNDIWKEEVQDSVDRITSIIDSINQKMKSDAGFADKVNRFVNDKASTEEITEIFSAMKSIDSKNGISFGEPVALQGVKELLQYVVNGTVDSNLYIEFDGKSCGPATQYVRYGSEISLHDLEVAWRSGNFLGYPADLRQLKKDIADLEAKTDRTEAENKQLEQLKDIVANDGYMIMAKESVKYCKKVKERAELNKPAAAAFNALDSVMKKTVLRIGTFEIKASIPLTNTLSKGFRALAKLIGTPMVYGAGAVAEAKTIAQGILRGIDYRFYKTVKYLEVNGLANNSATANTFLNAFFEANKDAFNSVDEVKDYFNQILTMTSATTNVSGNTLDEAIINMNQLSNGNILIRSIMDNCKDLVSADKSIMRNGSEISLSTIARSISWSSSDNLAVQSAVQTFITEPMNIGANKAFPPSAKETVNAQTALSGAMGMLNQFVVANVVNVMSNLNGGYFNATMERQMFENPAIQKILTSTSLPHSDGDTRFFNYKFGHDADTFTSSRQNTSVIHVQINGQDFTISTKPTVMKAESMGVTSQPGITQGSGDGDIMARVVNKLYSLTAKLANKYGKNGKQTHIGSMFDGINVFLDNLSKGKPVNAIGEALSESIKQNVSVQTLEGVNAMIQLFNEAPELLISPTIGLAADSNRNIALGFGYKIAEAIESYSQNNPNVRNTAILYRNRLDNAKSVEDRAEALIQLLNSFAKVVETRAKRHEAKIAVLFGTPKPKNGVVDFLHPDSIERNADALPSSLQNFDTMEFGHSTTHESTKRAMDDAKAPLSATHTFYINGKGQLRIGNRTTVKQMQNVTVLDTRDEFIKSTTPEMIAEYCETRQEELLNSMQMRAVLDSNIKASYLKFPEFKNKGISQKELEDKLLAENITVSDFKNYLDALTPSIRNEFNSSGRKQEAKGFFQKIYELGSLARKVYFLATSGTRDIIDSAKVVSFNFNEYASKGDVEKKDYIKTTLKCNDTEADNYFNMLSRVKDFSNVKGLHLGVDAVLVTSKAMDDLQSTDAQERADAIANITEIVNHEVSHMAMLDAIETAYKYGNKSENWLINELKTKYGFNDADAQIEAGKIIAVRQLNNQVETAAEHIRNAHIMVLLKTFDKLCIDPADIRAQLNIPDNVPLQKTFDKFRKRLYGISNAIHGKNGTRTDALNALSDLYKDLATLEDKSDTNYKKIFNTVLAKQFKDIFQTELTQELRDGFEEISLVSTSGNHAATVQETLTWFLNQKNFYDLVYRRGKDITKLGADKNFQGYEIDRAWIEQLFGKRLSNLLDSIYRGLVNFYRDLRKMSRLNPAISNADMFQLLVTASQANLSTNFSLKPKGGKSIGSNSINAMRGSTNTSNTSSNKRNVKDLDKFINTYPDSFKNAMKGIQMVNTALDNLNRRGLTPFTGNQRAEFDYTLHSLLMGLGSGLPNTYKFAYLMDKGLKENRDKLSKDELDFITNLEKEISDPLTRGYAITALVSAKPQILDKINTKGIASPNVEADLSIEEPLAVIINTLAGEVNALTDPDVNSLTLKQSLENYKKDSWEDFNSFNFQISPANIGGRVKSTPVNNLLNKLDRGTSNLIRKSARALESVGGTNRVSQTIRKVGSFVDSMYGTSEYEQLNGEDFYDNIEEWADTNLDQNSFLQNFVKQQIREYTNHTRGTNSYHNVKKMSKNKVQQKAEALRSRTKIQLRKHCKDCKNWKAATRLFATGSFFKAKLTRNDLHNLLQNPNNIQKEIYKFPVSVEVSNAITKLVSFTQTGTCKDPENLIRNTYAISQLYNESFDVVNRLYTLYTLKHLQQNRLNDFNDLRDFIAKDINGEQLSYMNNLLSALYKTDLRKIANAPIVSGQRNHAFNFVEGRTPSVQEHQIIPTRDLNLVAKLKQEGWKEQKVSANGVHYMVQDIVVQSFHSGALQVVNNTAMGIDIDNGFSKNTVPYQAGMTSNKDEIIVPCYYHGARTMHYEVIPVQPVEDVALDSLIGDWVARYKIESNVDAANDMCMAELRKLYDKDPTSKRNINLSKLVDENGKIIDSEFKKANLSKYQRKAIERLFNCPRILPFIEKYFPDGLIVRRDLIDDALGMESASIVDIYTGNNNLPKVVNESLKAFCTVFGGERGAMQLEAELRAITKVAKNSQVIKSLVVPVANFTANVVQMWMSGIPLHIILKEYYAKGKECNRYIALTREYADLQLESINGKDVRARMDKIVEEIQAMSIAPVLRLGEFNTIQDDSDGDLTDTGSYFIKAIDKIKQSKEKFGKAGELLDELVTSEKTLLYKCEERTTQYGDFIAKSICYDYWKNKYNEKEAIFRVTSEFVDYDFMPSRGREWLEKIGWGWYWNYKLRMSKVMMRMIRENPFRSLLFLTLPPTLFDINLDTPFKDSALGRLFGMGPSLMSSLGFGHLFGLKNYIPVAGMF